MQPKAQTVKTVALTTLRASMDKAYIHSPHSHIYHIPTSNFEQDLWSKKIKAKKNHGLTVVFFCFYFLIRP
jgi:hypothetical protein